MTPLLSLNEQVLLRAWVRGVPLASLDIPTGQGSFTLLRQLRTRLYLKAVRLQQANAGLWLKKLNRESWEKAALHSLNYLLQHPDIQPEPGQPLEFWLVQQQVEALKAAGIATLGDFIRFFQSYGKRSWQQIPGLGRIGARQLEHTLTGLLPGQLAQKKALPIPVYATGIVPLGRLLVPANLDGARGSNRADAKPFIPMQHDLAAVQAWLALLDPSSHTHRSYQREAERLLLWAILERQKALSSLDAVDMAEYRRFLQDPQPAGTWIGPPQKKNHAQWKPFTGRLALRNVKYAETLMNGLFDFLVEQRYLQHNPLSALPKLKAPSDQIVLGVHRAFAPAQWTLIMAIAGQSVQESTGINRRNAIRTQLVLNLAYATGLRLHELTQAIVGDLFTLTRSSNSQQWLKVIGKGQKLRQVPLPPSAMALLGEAYQALTGQALLKQNPSYPLIPDLSDPSKSITPVGLHKIMKAFFVKVAKQALADEPDFAQQLLKASTHWLRHTHGSVAAGQQIPLTMIRDNLGHASIATTSHYLHAEADARYEAFREFDKPTDKEISLGDADE